MGLPPRRRHQRAAADGAVGLARHAVHQVGASYGPTFVLDDYQATGIRHREQQDRRFKESKDLWIVAGDVLV